MVRWTVQGDPTEGALIVAARKAGLESEELEARFKRVGRSAVLFRAQADEYRSHRCGTAGCLLVFTKGAPDVLLTRCSQELVGRRRGTLSRRAPRRRFWTANEELAGEALRTLGIAFR